MKWLVGWFLDGYFLVRSIGQAWGEAIDRAMDWGDED